MRQRFPNARKLRAVGTDRGVGFFHVCGKITTEYSEALRSQGMRAMQGEDARAQPGKMGDVLLHETAVAWIRAELQRTSPKKPCQESREEHCSRLREAARHNNANFDVEGLCAEWPSRIAELIARGGDKLSK